MRIDVDHDAGVLYVTLGSGPVSSTAPVGDLVNVDLNESGAVVGVEILTVGAWPVEDVLAAHRLPDHQVAVLRLLASMMAKGGVPRPEESFWVTGRTASTAVNVEAVTG